MLIHLFKGVWWWCADNKRWWLSKTESSWYQVRVKAGPSVWKIYVERRWIFIGWKSWESYKSGHSQHLSLSDHFRTAGSKGFFIFSIPFLFFSLPIFNAYPSIICLLQLFLRYHGASLWRNVLYTPWWTCQITFTSTQRSAFPKVFGRPVITPKDSQKGQQTETSNHIPCQWRQHFKQVREIKEHHT